MVFFLCLGVGLLTNSPTFRAIVKRLCSICTEQSILSSYCSVTLVVYVYRWYTHFSKGVFFSTHRVFAALDHLFGSFLFFFFFFFLGGGGGGGAGGGGFNGSFRQYLCSCLAVSQRDRNPLIQWVKRRPADLAVLDSRPARGLVLFNRKQFFYFIQPLIAHPLS